MKEQMPCGFPGMGIPPLAPFKMSHQNIDRSIGGNSFDGEVNDFELSGLNDFDIIQMNVNLVLRRAIFNFNFNDISMKTNYNMAAELALFGGLKKNMGEKATFQLKNLNVWGRLKYSLGLLGGGIKITEFSVYVSLGEVNSNIEGFSKYKIINRKFNDSIEEWLMLAINDNTNNIADLTNKHIMPVMNDLIGGRSIGDLLGLLGGGGEGGSGGEKVPCVPEEL